jgi:peptidoglycan/LPS O-acetylase OafA/YrhL
VKNILLKDALVRGNNNFDLYRLIAALMVIWGHAYALMPNPQGEDLIAQLTGYTYSGSVAVKLFFFLSGLLIANSLIRGTNLTRYFIHRATRIFPGLIVSLTVVTWIVGALVSTIGVERYLLSSETWQIFLHNLTVGPFTLSIRQFLPGVFESLPYSDSQGTLWSIPIELACYVFLALAWVTIRRFRNWSFVLISATLLLGVIRPDIGFLPSGEVGMAIWAFSFGVVASLFQDHIRVGPLIVVLLGALALVLSGSILNEVLFVLFLFALFLFLSTRSIVTKLKLPGDYSYGVYLYGWPIQQILLVVNFSESTLMNQLVTMFAAVLVGAASWHIIEKPMISLGKSWTPEKKGKQKFPQTP